MCVEIICMDDSLELMISLLIVGHILPKSGVSNICNRQGLRSIVWLLTKVSPVNSSELCELVPTVSVE